jgi:hypothetical protein
MVRSSEGRLSNISTARYFLLYQYLHFYIELGRTFMKSASSSASLVSVFSTVAGLIAVFRPDLFRAFLLFGGASVDFSINGVERQSLRSWKLELSASSITGLLRGE